MNILISIDNNFVDITIDMLNSIYLYNNVFLNVYLIYENLTKTNILKLEKFLTHNNIGKLYPYYYDFSYQNFKINIPHITRETYFRLFAPYILPQNIDKILYLDGDIICNGKIDKLYNTDFDGNIFVACENIDPDPIFVPWINHRLGLPPNNTYYNAGVLLINLPLYREFTSLENLINFINANISKIWLQDQDILNKLFNGKIKKIDNTFNYPITHIDINNISYNKILVHYLSPPKPWKTDYCRPFYGISYYKYLIKTSQLEKLHKLLNCHIKNAKLNIFEVKKLLDLIFNNYN